MRDYLMSRNTLVWLILMAVTLVSWLLSRDAVSSVENASIDSMALIVLAFVKVRLVMQYFMEVRQAPTGLKLACDSWVVLSCAGILSFYSGILPL